MANTPITPFRLTNLTRARLEQLSAQEKRTMSDTVAYLIHDAAMEAGIVAIVAVETKPEHDPYINIDGRSSYTALWIDPRDRTAGVSQEYRTGSWTMDLHHRLTLELGIVGHPDESAVRGWLTAGRGQELLRAVCDGFDDEWDGNNMVGTYNDDAQAALDELARELDDEGESRWGNHYEYWNVEEWENIEQSGVTAETTDEELAAIAANSEEIAQSQNIALSGDIAEYLRRERESLREEAEYEAD